MNYINQAQSTQVDQTKNPIDKNVLILTNDKPK